MFHAGRALDYTALGFWRIRYRDRSASVAFLLMFSLQCLFPIFDSSRPDEFLGLSIVNRDNQPREFTVTATAPEGTNAQTGRVSIPAGGQRAQLINEILG